MHFFWSIYLLQAYPGGNKESYLISAKQDGKKTLGENIVSGGMAERAV